MAKRDEVHPAAINKRHSILVSLTFLIAVLLLTYLAVYSFNNLNPVITIILIVVLLIVVAIGIFAIEATSMREVH